MSDGDPIVRPKLGLTASVAICIGDIIGSGIFISPQGILQNTGSVALSLIIWLATGLLALLGSLCYIELGTSIPKTGQDFAYLNHIGWDPLAFMFLWCSVIIYRPCVLGVLSRTFGKYVVQALEGHFCFSPSDEDGLQRILAFLMLFLLAYINSRRIDRYAAVFSIVTTSCKIGALLVIIGTGIAYVTRNGLGNLQDPFNGTEVTPAGIVLAAYSGLWAYDGWTTLNIVVEELQNPARTLPLGAFITLTVCIIVYILTNLSYYAVLGRNGVLASSAVAETLSQQELGWFSQVLPWLIGVVLAGTMNSSIFSGARFYIAAAKAKHVPACFELLNMFHGTPQVALTVAVTLGAILGSISSIDQLINLLTFVDWLGRCFVMCGLLYIRIRHIPVHPNAIRMPLAIHVIFLLICIALVIVPIYQNPVLTGGGFAVYFSGLLVYYALVWPKNKPRWMQQMNVWLTVQCQKLFTSLPDAVVDNGQNCEDACNHSQNSQQLVERF